MDASTLRALTDAGVSLWLDDLGRGRLTDGSLQRLVDEAEVRGITTNPTIFAKAVAAAGVYDEQLAELARGGATVEEAVRALTTTDVRDACDLLLPLHRSTDGVDGKVSLEVDPRLARDTEATVAEARELWDAVDRPNLMIKIPATVEGLPAVRRCLAAGISVNVTLIFGLDRYADVVDAFLSGLEDARAAGHDLATIASVASFFVSRVDTDVDARLEQVGTPEALELRGRAALANARLAYAHHREVLASDRWAALAAAGARPQRPLWASTGVKNPDYDPALYVAGLVAPGTVNTVPEATLRAAAEFAGPVVDTVSGTETVSRDVLDRVEALGIGYADLVARLEENGVRQFEDSWTDLLTTVGTHLTPA